MARFTFRLERILELRRHRESAARERYGAASRHSHELESAIADRHARRREALVAPRGSDDPMTRAATDAWALRLAAEAEALSRQLAAAEGARREAENEYRAARRDVEVLERLRETRETQWKTERLRAEHTEILEYAITTPRSPEGD